MKFVEEAVASKRQKEEHIGLSRRELLRNAAIAGVGTAGVLMYQEVASAAPPVEKITAIYDINGNGFLAKMTILSQTGNSFSGSFDNGTPISGTVTGTRPDFNVAIPITIVFNRVLSDGTIQIWIGAVSTRPAGPDKDVFLAGVFYQDGTGPYPWSATGKVIG